MAGDSLGMESAPALGQAPGVPPEHPTLAEGDDIGKAVDNAIKAIEATNPELKDILPRGYQKLERPTLIELLPGADPARKEWGRLHAFSAAVLLVRLLASTALFVLLSRKPRRTIAVTPNAAAEGPTAA